MNQTNNGIAAFIRAEREKRGMSREKMAEACGVTRTCVEKWENGKTAIPFSQVVRIMDAFGYNVVIEEKEGM